MDNNNNNNSFKDEASKISDENPSNTIADPAVVAEEPVNPNRPAAAVTRTPFTNLSQVDADLALARTLQDQVCVIV